MDTPTLRHASQHKLTFRKDLNIFLSMPPLRIDSENLYKRCLTDLGSRYLADHHVRLTRLDSQVSQQDNAWNLTLRLIDTSHILIADLSPNTLQAAPDANVLYHVGYAAGRRMPCILICQKDSINNIPSNLKDHESPPLVYDLDDQDNLRQFTQDLAEKIHNLSDGRPPRYKGDFQVECFTRRDSNMIQSMIREAQKYVYILTTSLDYVHSYLMGSIQEALTNNARNKAFKVVMITIDPESEVTNGRAEQLGRPLRNFRDELRRSLDQVVKNFQKHRGQVEILTYQTLPTQITYIIDDRVIAALFSLGQQSRDSINFLIDEPALTQRFMANCMTLRAMSRQVNP